MAITARSASLAGLVIGLSLGIGIGWSLMKTRAKWHLAQAWAANAATNLRIIEALRENDPATATEWVTTGLTGNVVVLGAWADDTADRADLATKTLRRIAELDAEHSIFNADPDFKNYVARFRQAP